MGKCAQKAVTDKEKKNMKTSLTKHLTYVAPVTLVDEYFLERTIMSAQTTLHDMDCNDIYDEDF